MPITSIGRANDMAQHLQNPPGSPPRMIHQPAPEPVVNKTVRQWLDECIALCQPEAGYFLNGRSHERQDLINQAVRDGMLIKFNQEKLAGWYLHRSDQNQLARSGHLNSI